MVRKVMVPLLLCLGLSGCDPQRLRKCEWYLIPNPEADKVTPEGWVSVCVANPQLGRQKCYYAVLPELANRFNGVPFRYSTMETKDTFPREITNLTQCTPGS